MSPLDILRLLRLIERLMSSFLPVQTLIKNLEERAGNSTSSRMKKVLYSLIGPPSCFISRLKMAVRGCAVVNVGADRYLAFAIVKSRVH